MGRNVGEREAPEVAFWGPPPVKLEPGLRKNRGSPRMGSRLDSPFEFPRKAASSRCAVSGAAIREAYR